MSSLLKSLFVTLTNVNFDPEAIAVYVRKTAELHDQLQKQLKAKADYSAFSVNP